MFSSQPHTAWHRADCKVTNFIANYLHSTPKTITFPPLFPHCNYSLTATIPPPYNNYSSPHCCCSHFTLALNYVKVCILYLN